MYPGEFILPWVGYPSPFIYPGTSFEMFANSPASPGVGSPGSPRRYYIIGGRRVVR